MEHRVVVLYSSGRKSYSVTKSCKCYSGNDDDDDDDDDCLY